MSSWCPLARLGSGQELGPLRYWNTKFDDPHFYEGRYMLLAICLQHNRDVACRQQKLSFQIFQWFSTLAVKAHKGMWNTGCSAVRFWMTEDKVKRVALFFRQSSGFSRYLSMGTARSSLSLDIQSGISEPGVLEVDRVHCHLHMGGLLVRRNSMY